MMDKPVFACALVGIALIAGLRGSSGLRAAEKKTPSAKASSAAAKKEKVIGIVTEKGDKFVMVKPEGSHEPKRYALAADAAGALSADLQAAMKTVFVPNLVALEIQARDEPVVTGIHVIAPTTRFGTVTGTVVAKDKQARGFSVDVKPTSRGFTECYWPQFIISGGKGGMDEAMIQTLSELNIGDRVRIAWGYDERKRAVKVQVTTKAKPTRADKEAKPDHAP